MLSSQSIGIQLNRDEGGSREGLVGDILRTLVSAMPENVSNPDQMQVDGVVEAKNYKFLPQDVLQPFCARFSSIPSARRVTLLKTAMDALGPCALPACTSVLLAHSLSSYDPEGAPGKTVSEFEGSSPTGGLILLSRSSQRKASRSLKTSQAEELFRLATDTVLTKSAETQVGTLVALIKSAQQLLAFSAVMSEEEEGSGDLILVDIEGVGEMVLDVAKLQTYSESLTDMKKQINEESNEETDKQGSAAASLLLQLEFVYEVLENKLFHKQLIPLIDTENGSEILQSYFLELSEQILQLLALSSRVQSNDDKEFLVVRLGDVAINITLESLGMHRVEDIHELMNN